MPSDPRVAAALIAVQPQIAQYRSAVAKTLDRARRMLAETSGPAHVSMTLGAFAGGRIDPERFAMISAGAVPLDATEKAIATCIVKLLESILRAGDEQFIVHVPEGASVHDAVAECLATFGVAFSARALTELVRRHESGPSQYLTALESYGFARWTATERKVAPPLVVSIHGGVMDASDLAPFIDEGTRFIVVANDACPLAPLARLISPGTFVAQTDDLSLLERLPESSGPVVVALMVGKEARFVHDPRAGASTWQRLTVTRDPEGQSRKDAGSRSSWQQKDDLAHLRALAEEPSFATSAPATGTSVRTSATEATDRLTAWLVEQSTVSGVA